jgi:hypothetical protein
MAKTMSIDAEMARELLRWIAWDLAIDMSCDTLNFVEERRVWWTSYNHLELWFGTWKREPTNLGLMEKDERGTSFIPPAKLQQILNFDKTSSLLECSSINQQG